MTTTAGESELADADGSIVINCSKEVRSESMDRVLLFDNISNERKLGLMTTRAGRESLKIVQLLATPERKKRRDGSIDNYSRERRPGDSSIVDN